MATIKIKTFEIRLKSYSTKRLKLILSDSNYAVNARKAAKNILSRR